VLYDTSQLLLLLLMLAFVHSLPKTCCLLPVPLVMLGQNEPAATREHAGWMVCSGQETFFSFYSYPIANQGG